MKSDQHEILQNQINEKNNEQANHHHRTALPRLGDGQAQTKKTAIVKGYSPALEDSTLVNIYIDNMSVASDTVFGGRFTLSVPVEKLTQSRLFPSSTEGIMGDMYYSDFSLTFESFEIIPETFDFKKGDAQSAFVIRHISTDK